MKTFVTFGQCHSHSVDGKTFDKDCIAVIDAEDEGKAREIAFEAFGNKFCVTCREENFDMDNMHFFPRGFIDLN